MAVLEKQQQFDFQNNGIEVMNLETLQRTYKENDIYGKPVQGIYHYQVLQRMTDICEKYNLDYEVEEIFAAQNRNKTQPGVSILPQVEQTHGEKAVEAHILRRIFATIRIKDWETDELTTTLAVAYHQDGIQAAIGPCVKICHNQCILSPERSICNYGKNKVTTEGIFETVYLFATDSIFVPSMYCTFKDTRPSPFIRTTVWRNSSSKRPSHRRSLRNRFIVRKSSPNPSDSNRHGCPAFRRLCN